jgi:hypothetical protein
MIMRSLLTFLLLFLAVQTVFSQKSGMNKGFVYPTVNKYGKTFDDFSPKNWEITDTIPGDLDKDGVDDFALVLDYSDSIKIKDGYKYPRILLLVFKVRDHYELKLQHNTLIEYETTAGNGSTGGWDGDPFESMEIVNGVLKLHFKWDVRGVGTSIRYVVRYQSNNFYLIGATYKSGYRSDTKTFDVNFSSKKYTCDEINDETGFGGKYNEYHKKGKLPANTLKKLINIKAPGTWDITEFGTI